MRSARSHLAIADIMKAGHDGTLEEVFGTGTAAVVSPVKELDWKGDKVFISGGQIGQLTQRLYDTLTGIQWGKLPDTKGWIVPVCKGLISRKNREAEPSGSASFFIRCTGARTAARSAGGDCPNGQAEVPGPARRRRGAFQTRPHPARRRT